MYSGSKMKYFKYMEPVLLYWAKKKKFIRDFCHIANFEFTG